jgi:uncharacterized protein YggT (Ycf19 family)
MADKDDPRVTGLRFAKVLVWLIYAYFLVALVILVLMFFLQLFDASTTAEFTRWVYRSGDRVMEPFRGIFPTKDVGQGGSVIDFAVLFAIIVYGILALLAPALVRWIDLKIIAMRDATTSPAGTAPVVPGAPGPSGAAGTFGAGTPQGSVGGAFDAQTGPVVGAPGSAAAPPTAVSQPRPSTGGGSAAQPHPR